MGFRLLPPASSSSTDTSGSSLSRAAITQPAAPRTHHDVVEPVYGGCRFVRPLILTGRDTAPRPPACGAMTPEGPRGGPPTHEEVAGRADGHGEPRILFRQQDPDAVFGKGRHHTPQLSHRERRESDRRFVHQNDLGLTRDRARDADHLPLATRKARRQGVRLLRQHGKPIGQPRQLSGNDDRHATATLSRTVSAPNTPRPPGTKLSPARARRYVLRSESS